MRNSLQFTREMPAMPPWSSPQSKLKPSIVGGGLSTLAAGISGTGAGNVMGLLGSSCTSTRLGWGGIIRPPVKRRCRKAPSSSGRIVAHSENARPKAARYPALSLVIAARARR